MNFIIDFLIVMKKVVHVNLIYAHSSLYRS
jgi:hypothetical protein